MRSIKYPRQNDLMCDLNIHYNTMMCWRSKSNVQKSGSTDCNS